MIGRRAVVALPWLLACGYAPLRAAEAAMSVRAGRSTVAEPRVLTEATEGARRALIREGAHDPASSHVLVIDVVRLDEATSGLARGARGVAGRGTTLSLVGRARVLPSGFETGEIEVADESGGEADALLDAARRAEVAIALGRRLGAALALTILGLPTTDRARL